jgi:hypothetical protein
MHCRTDPSSDLPARALLFVATLQEQGSWLLPLEAHVITQLCLDSDLSDCWLHHSIRFTRGLILQGVRQTPTPLSQPPADLSALN